MHAESKEPSARGKSEPEFSYFQIQALWGVTKHIGGLKDTEQLAELCQIDKDKYVLEVGCGIGTTACYLAKRYGCRVVGVDISEKMVEWAHKRAKRAGLQERVQFRIADAQTLAFEDALFDAVISESVTAFPEDRQKVVSEYVRVTKTGGYIGLNEGTWMKPSPPPELVRYIGHTMAGAKFLTSDGWKELLEGGGLRDITMRTYKLSARSQWIEEMRGPSPRDSLDRLRAFGSFLSLYLKSSSFRKYAKEIMPSRKTLGAFFTYLGYGLYVGRKQT